MTHRHVIAPALDVGSVWRLPSGSVVEVLPNLVVGDYVICKYRPCAWKTPETTVSLSREFLERWGK
jgi:hypothetical protein